MVQTDTGPIGPMIGWLPPGHPCHAFADTRGQGQFLRLSEPAWVVVLPQGGYGLAPVTGPAETAAPGAMPICGWMPRSTPEFLGDSTFRATHGVELACYAGSMANGISSVELVESMGRGGMLGFFGAAGLTVDQVERAIDALQASLGDRPFGFNLINSLNDPRLEEELVALYLRKGVRLIEAAAYMDLSLPLVQYRVQGIGQDGAGRVSAPNRIIAKVSREEVASKFLAPPPAPLLDKLVASGRITAEAADMAREIPMASDLTAEADSGGHTDNRPALGMLPTFIALRDRLQGEYGFPEPVRIGLAGGISTPAAAAAAFAMGAAYVVTGSVNQACVESGTSNEVRRMLAETRQADVAMAPSADMFEMGVSVQVLKRGTMFSMRAAQLYNIYRLHDRIEDIPVPDRAKLEKTVFRASFEEVWRETREFFSRQDPAQVARAEKDPKHKLALICRSYLGQASGWANRGEMSRKIDFQVWCGPAMGAFNEWVRGSFLEKPENRRVVTVARNILGGAARLARCNHLRAQGIPLPPGAERIIPVAPDQEESMQQV